MPDESSFTWKEWLVVIVFYGFVTGLLAVVVGGFAWDIWNQLVAPLFSLAPIAFWKFLVAAWVFGLLSALFFEIREK